MEKEPAAQDSVHKQPLRAACYYRHFALHQMKNRSMYKKYLLIFIILATLLYFLDNRWLIAGWCSLGVLSAFWIPEARFPLLNIIGLETGIGILYWVSFW